MKKIIVSAIVAVFMLGSTAMAAPSGCPFNAHKMNKPCPSMGCGSMPCDDFWLRAVPSDKKDKVFEIVREYAPKMAEINDKICVKHWELKALSHSSQTSEKSISNVVRELESLMDMRRGLKFERLNKLESVLGKDFFMKAQPRSKAPRAHKKNVKPRPAPEMPAAPEAPAAE